MKILKYLFLILILLIPNIIFAENVNLNDFETYRDQSLQLKFSYPREWGNVGTNYNINLQQAIDPFYANFTYDVVFKNNKNMLFSTAEKPMSTIEKIYNTSISEFCNNIKLEDHNISNCQNLANNIISFLPYSSYQDYCGELPDRTLITKIISIDLLDNDFMDVLTFKYSFLSADFQKELTDIIDKGGCHYPREEGYDETSTLFNNKVQEILDRIDSGDIDEETKTNLENFDYFANSIEEWTAFENWPDWAQTEITWALNKNILDSDESVLEKVDEESFKYTLAKMLYSYHINNDGEKYNEEIISGKWSDWADEGVSWGINQKIFDSAETVVQEVSEKDFKYMLATMLYRYYLSLGGEKYAGEIISGNWPDWADESVSWAINEKIIKSRETVMEPVSQEAFKYTFSIMLNRYDKSAGYLTKNQ